MLKLGPDTGLSRAFFSFLEIACALNSDSDDRFTALVRNYDKQQRYLFMEAYSALVLEMAGDGSGLVDVLGDFFTKYICPGWKVTPQQYYDMLPAFSGLMALGSGWLITNAALAGDCWLLRNSTAISGSMVPIRISFLSGSPCLTCASTAYMVKLPGMILQTGCFTTPGSLILDPRENL
jgi:hypothetical protein